MQLPRTLEPEVMDSAAEARAYDVMDHRQVNHQFVEDLVQACPRPVDCLDLGCGNALIPILLCQRRPDCRVLAVDQSAAMLDTARYRIEIEGMADRIQLAQADAKQLGFPDAMFDCVFSNSIVHHVPQPLPVLQHALRVTRPGGCIFFRDLLRPASSVDVDRLVELYAQHAESLARDLFRASLHAALTLDEIRDQIRALQREPGEVQATSDRHWTWIAQA